MKNRNITMLSEIEEGGGVKPKYSNEKNYAIGSCCGPYQNGKVVDEEDSSFSDSKKAEEGLTFRSPL